jgi:hypothetical protein
VSSREKRFVAQGVMPLADCLRCQINQLVRAHLERDDPVDLKTWSPRSSNPVEGGHTLFGFLTTDANAVVKPIHPKAMLVILMTEAEIERWITAPAAEALELQRPAPKG